MRPNLFETEEKELVCRCYCVCGIPSCWGRRCWLCDVRRRRGASCRRVLSPVLHVFETWLTLRFQTKQTISMFSLNQASLQHYYERLRQQLMKDVVVPALASVLSYRFMCSLIDNISEIRRNRLVSLNFSPFFYLLFITIPMKS